MANTKPSKSEKAFLKDYNPHDYPPVGLATDVVLFTLQNNHLEVLLVARQEHPHQHTWTLPGAFVGPQESPEDAAARTLASKVGLDGVYLEQLYTFGAPNRDPRMRVVSVAYMALVEASRLNDLKNTQLAQIKDTRIHVDNRPVTLGFDHQDIVQTALRRLRGKLEYASVGYEFLPKRFTLRDLQHVHETILGKRLNKDSFRRKMLQSNELTPTGEFETGQGFRPAEYHRHRNTRRTT